MTQIDHRISKKGQADPLKSTYKQVIILKPGHPKNKVPKLTGYSAGDGFSESKDKIYVLARWIIRMYQKGYFDPTRVIRIEYYRWNTEKMDFSDFIFQVTPKDYSFTNDKELRTNKRFQEWVIKFFKYILTRDQACLDALEIKPARITDADVFSLSVRKFENEAALNNYCQILERKGHNTDEIHNFWIKYREKFTFTPAPAQLQQLANHFKAQ